MSKDIKVISCPNCGSIHKTELKPDYFRCDSCQTTYFLDSDEVRIHVYHHHQSQSAPLDVKKGQRVAIAIFVVLIGLMGVGYWLVTSPSNNTYTPPVIKVPYMFFGSFIFADGPGGNPVYLRFANETLKGADGNYNEINVHAIFTSALDGKVLKDRILSHGARGQVKTDYSLQVFPGNQVFVVFNKSTLYQVDTRSFEFIDITRDMFGKYPQLSNGIADIKLLDEEEALRLLTNDGYTFFLLPATGQLYDNGQAMTKARYGHSFFVFRYANSHINVNEQQQLSKATPTGSWPDLNYTDLTPGRRYFGPRIIYQDADNLLITVHTTAGEDAPVAVQSLDIHSGNVKWALPAGEYYYSPAVKCKQGFAIPYRTGPAADYIHGAFVVSPTGKMVHDYTLARTE